MKYFLTLLALVLPLHALAQIDDFLKSVITTIDTVTTEIVKQGKGPDAYLKNEANESNSATEASPDSSSSNASTNASATSSASSLGSVARSNSTSQSTPKQTTASASNKVVVNHITSTQITEVSYGGKFENGKVKIHVFQDNRGESAFTSSLCKGQWGIIFVDKYTLGSMKVNGVVFAYSPDYSSFELQSLDKYKKCLPNLQYSRILSPKSEPVTKMQTAQVITSMPQPIIEKLTAKEAVAKDEKALQQSACSDDEKAIFSCTIKGKPLNYCYLDQGGMKMITLKADLNGEKINTSAYDLRDSGEKPPYAEVQHKASNSDGRDLHMTVFMEGVQGKTYAITECGGMRCGVYMSRPWFTIFNNGKQVFNELCDEDSLTIANFNYTYDKKGRIVNDGLYRETKKKLNINPPQIE